MEIEANGLRFHAVRRGQGQLLLLLHGFPENWFSWRHQLAHFHTRFTVVAVDMRCAAAGRAAAGGARAGPSTGADPIRSGYGDTERPSGRDAYGIDVLVADVRALVHALGAETCHLAGHDWGGNVAWCARKQPSPESDCELNFTSPFVTIGAGPSRTSTRTWCSR